MAEKINLMNVHVAIDAYRRVLEISSGVKPDLLGQNQNNKNGKVKTITDYKADVKDADVIANIREIGLRRVIKRKTAAELIGLHTS